MRRLLVLGLLALVASAPASAGDVFAVVPDGAVLPAAEPNASSVALRADWTSAPAAAESRSVDELRRVWQAAGEAYGVPWSVLAAINKIESDFGRNMGPSSAGAIGWMQFMPATWLMYGTDGNADGAADPWNPVDAVYSAARYLAAAGAPDDLEKAIFAYNHADWYVRDVLELARTFEAGGEIAAPADEPDDLVADAQASVEGLAAELERARADAAALEPQVEPLAERAETAPLIEERLEASMAAADLDRRRAAAAAEVRRLEAALARAEQALAEAREQARATPSSLAFDPAAGGVVVGPVGSGDHVFPVGGGPALVSVSHTHHDYPAADIAAPAGTPVFALADATVLRTYPSPPEGRCGIGLTIQTFDGETWTYCHLSYLDVNLEPGTALVAGQSLGLVGTTGNSSGPHLHLQLQPAGEYPQEREWFAALAGTAFRWQEDAPEEPETPASVPHVFAVVQT